MGRQSGGRSGAAPGSPRLALNSTPDPFSLLQRSRTSTRFIPSLESPNRPYYKLTPRLLREVANGSRLRPLLRCFRLLRRFVLRLITPYGNSEGDNQDARRQRSKGCRNPDRCVGDFRNHFHHRGVGVLRALNIADQDKETEKLV